MFLRKWFNKARRFLCKLLDCKKYQDVPVPPVTQEPNGWAVETTDGITLHTEGLSMILNTEQRVKLSIRPLTAGGNPARTDGAVQFISDNVTVARIERISDNALACYAYGVSPGTTRLIARFDADLGDGVRTLEYDADITVIEAEAASASGGFDIPELVLTPVGEPPIEEPTDPTEPTPEPEPETPTDPAPPVEEPEAPTEPEAPADPEPEPEAPTEEPAPADPIPTEDAPIDEPTPTEPEPEAPADETPTEEAPADEEEDEEADDEDEDEDAEEDDEDEDEDEDELPRQ